MTTVAFTELRPELPAHLADLAPEVTVIGDLILDTWVHGTSHRLAREAPAPVVDKSHELFAPGGGANTAMNLAAMGAQVRMVGVVGDDPSGQRLKELLDASGVDTSSLLVVPSQTTTTKSRVVVEGQVLFRLDTPLVVPTAEVLEELTLAAMGAIAGSEAVIICDYDGAVHRTDLSAQLGRAAKRPLIVIDSHDPRRWVKARPDLITPNCAETEKILENKLGSGMERVDAAINAAAELLEKTGAAQAVVTLDKEGTLLLDGTEMVHRTWANPATEKQTSGAGDTFVAALTLACVGQLTMSTALDFAQAAADVVVHRLGTSLCSTADLTDYFSDFHNSLMSTADLLKAVSEHRAKGERIILTNGCFDLLHRGHTSYLHKAKKLGDVLIVAINDDDSVRRLKGPDRPINPLMDRAGVLGALSCVDYITAFSTDTPIPLISELRPDIYVKGGDYTPEMLRETPVVEMFGGEVRILEYISDHSTTEVIRRTQRAGGQHVIP